MRIKTSKNTIKQVKGTNAFEVQTIGERTDLDELRNKLVVHGFNFNPNGESENSYKRLNELTKHANQIEGEKRAEAMDRIYSIQEDLNEYSELYSWVNDKIYEYKYVLDMNNIEIVTEQNVDGEITAKAVINLVKNTETDELLSWKEVGSSIETKESNLESQSVEVGNAIKNISERTNSLRTYKELNYMGIDMKNENGNFKTVKEVLKELSKLNDKDMMEASKIMAGQYNANHLFALIKNI